MAAGEPFADGRLLPHGRLREPASAIRRASHVVLIDSPAAGRRPRADCCATARIIAAGAGRAGGPRAAGAERLPAAGWESGRGAPPGGRRGAAGARPRARRDRSPGALRRHPRGGGVPVAGHRFFRDHHPIRQPTGRRSDASRGPAGAAAIVTTEKDEPRLLAAEAGQFPAPLCRCSWRSWTSPSSRAKPSSSAPSRPRSARHAAREVSA